jgi:hypothetical protein
MSSGLPLPFNRKPPTEQLAPSRSPSASDGGMTVGRLQDNPKIPSGRMPTGSATNSYSRNSERRLWQLPRKLLAESQRSLQPHKQRPKISVARAGVECSFRPSDETQLLPNYLGVSLARAQFLSLVLLSHMLTNPGQQETSRGYCSQVVALTCPLKYILPRIANDLILVWMIPSVAIPPSTSMGAYEAESFLLPVRVGLA